jgi:hypothetical protein
MKNTIALTRGILLAAACAACCSSALAPEGGSDTIGEGAEAFFAGALPPIWHRSKPGG